MLSAWTFLSLRINCLFPSILVWHVLSTHKICKIQVDKQFYYFLLNFYVLPFLNFKACESETKYPSLYRAVKVKIVIVILQICANKCTGRVTESFAKLCLPERSSSPTSLLAPFVSSPVLQEKTLRWSVYSSFSFGI